MAKEPWDSLWTKWAPLKKINGFKREGRRDWPQSSKASSSPAALYRMYSSLWPCSHLKTMSSSVSLFSMLYPQRKSNPPQAMQAITAVVLEKNSRASWWSGSDGSQKWSKQDDHLLLGGLSSQDVLSVQPVCLIMARWEQASRRHWR